MYQIYKWRRDGMVDSQDSDDIDQHVLGLIAAAWKIGLTVRLTDTMEHIMLEITDAIAMPEPAHLDRPYSASIFVPEDVVL